MTCHNEWTKRRAGQVRETRIQGENDGQCNRSERCVISCARCLGTVVLPFLDGGTIPRSRDIIRWTLNRTHARRVVTQLPSFPFNWIGAPPG